MNVYVAVNSDQFTANNIQLFYMDKTMFTPLNDLEAPSNNPVKEFFSFSVDESQADILIQFAFPMCRFTSQDGTTVMQTYGMIMHQPINEHGPPNNLECRSPKWPLANAVKFEIVKLDISLNGVNFDGGFDFTITAPLKLDRIIPAAGPLVGSHNMHLIGTGFLPKSQNL